jgi:hypothetical protein
MKGGLMKLEQEIETLKKRVKLLEEFRELQKKVEELEKQIAKPIVPYIPYYPVYPQPYTPYPTWRYTYDTNSGTKVTDGATFIATYGK